jgi:uncharacterized secreted protein with C-terminal beta-propeller domain
VFQILVMRVYIVDSDGHMPSCLDGLSEKLRIYCEGIVVLYVFLCTYSFGFLW